MQLENVLRSILHRREAGTDAPHSVAGSFAHVLAPIAEYVDREYTGALVSDDPGAARQVIAQLVETWASELPGRSVHVGVVRALLATVDEHDLAQLLERDGCFGRACCRAAR